MKAIKAYAFAECDKLKKITFAGTPDKLSRHIFDDCDLLHDIIVPAGSSKFFRKELHFIDGDTDFLVLEVPDKDSKEPSKNKKDEKASEKKANAEKKEKTSEKKTVEENAEKKETSAKKDNKAKKEPVKTK